MEAVRICAKVYTFLCFYVCLPFSHVLFSVALKYYMYWYMNTWFFQSAHVGKQAHLHTYVHTHTSTHTHSYILKHTYTHSLTNIHTHSDMCTLVRTTHMCIHILSHCLSLACMHRHPCACSQACMHTGMCTHVHTNTHTHTHTHTEIWVLSWNLIFPLLICTF